MLKDKTDAEAETFRRTRESSYDTWKRGWSDSKLALPGPLEGREKQEADDIARIEARLKARGDREKAKNSQNMRSFLAYPEAKQQPVIEQTKESEQPVSQEAEVLKAEDEKYKSLLDNLDSKID